MKGSSKPVDGFMPGERGDGKAPKMTLKNHVDRTHNLVDSKGPISRTNPIGPIGFFNR
jgi:hypothetical protein